MFGTSPIRRPLRRPHAWETRPGGTAASLRLSSGWQASAVNHPHTSCHGSSRRDAAMLQAPTPGHLVRAPIPGAARETARGRRVCQPHPGVFGVCPYLEPKLGIAKKRQLLLFVLREKSSKNDFLRGICCLKLLFSVQTENFTEERYRLIQ